MEPVDRLAAFLAGELSADEQAAIEAELARDGALRDQLAAMRRADGVLAELPATELPDGARDRLLTALGPVLADQFGAGDAPDRADRPAGASDADTSDADATDAGATVTRARRTAPADELARRRRASNRRSWLVGLGGVAAAAVGVAILGPVLSGADSGNDTADVAMMTTDEAAPESAAGGEGAQDDSAAAIAPVGPTLLGSGRSVDAEGIADLLTAGELDAVVARDLSADDARAIGASWAAALGAAPDGPAAGVPDGFGDLDAATEDAGRLTDRLTDEAETTAPVDDGEFSASDTDASDPDASDLERLQTTDRERASVESEVGTADVQILGEVSDEDRAAVGRCLSTLLTPNAVLVPALAELISFAGEPAIAFALVGDAADGSVTRREVWVLDREGCEVRYLRQD